jgi:hypothetical protein
VNARQVAVGTVGLLIALVGLVLGLQTHELFPGGGQAASCGSAFAPVHFAPNYQDFFGKGAVDLSDNSLCRQVLKSPRILSISLVTVGVVVLGGGIAVCADRKPNARELPWTPPGLR